MHQSLRQFVQQAYQRFGPPLTRRAFVILGDYGRAEDAVQETFITLIVEIKRGRMDVNQLSMAWLIRVTTNLCLNIKRKLKRVVLTEQFDLLCTREKRDLTLMHSLNQWLGEMPAQLRDITVYRYIDEMTVDEIGDMTQISRRTIHRRLERIQKWFHRRVPDLALSSGTGEGE